MVYQSTRCITGQFQRWTENTLLPHCLLKCICGLGECLQYKLLGLLFSLSCNTDMAGRRQVTCSLSLCIMMTKTRRSRQTDRRVTDVCCTLVVNTLTPTPLENRWLLVEAVSKGRSTSETLHTHIIIIIHWEASAHCAHCYKLIRNTPRKPTTYCHCLKKYCVKYSQIGI